MATTTYAGVHAALTDPSFIVPPVPQDAPPGGIAWLRASVARFSTGSDHARRRALATADLARLDPAALRRQAFIRTGERMAVRHVLVAVLADALGLAAIDPETVRTTASAYHPHTEATPAADDAVAQLVTACGGVADEATAARIGLFVQACDATAGLVEHALPNVGAEVSTDALLAETLRHDPPVRATRRQSEGTLVVLDLAAANRDPAVFTDPDRFDPGRDGPDSLTFGAGPHACPGRAHALALAAGILDALGSVR